MILAGDFVVYKEGFEDNRVFKIGFVDKFDYSYYDGLNWVEENACYGVHTYFRKATKEEIIHNTRS